MVSKERTKEILNGLQDAVVKYDEESVIKFSKMAVEEGVDALDAILHGLAAGMERVAQLYSDGKYYVPEVLLCSDTLYVGLDILKPHTKKSAAADKEKKQIVIGTIEGDVHDIGKNLVKMMFDIAGWTVHDLGKDVKLEKFVEEQKRTKADVVALSALMTTTMMAMPKLINMLKEKSPNVAVMIGGAPINPDVAKKFGADGYAPNAGRAVQEAINVLNQLKTTLGR